MTIAERYTRIRVESGIPGRFIMRYIDAGYHENTYARMEEGHVDSERINQRLCEMMKVKSRSKWNRTLRRIRSKSRSIPFCP